MIAQISRDDITSIIQAEGSGNPFPIDFDAAWQWIGYAKKEKAKAKLERNFDEESDYVKPDDLASPNGEASWGGQNRELIFLTIDCFKSFAMMAGTSRGRQVRKYFIECEKELRRIANNQVQGDLSSLHAALLEAREVITEKLAEAVANDQSHEKINALANALSEVRKSLEPYGDNRTALIDEPDQCTLVPNYPDRKLIRSLQQVSKRVGWLTPGMAKNAVYALRRDNNLNVSHVEKVFQILASQGVGIVTDRNRCIVWRYN